MSLASQSNRRDIVRRSVHVLDRPFPSSTSPSKVVFQAQRCLARSARPKHSLHVTHADSPQPCQALLDELQRFQRSVIDVSWAPLCADDQDKMVTTFPLHVPSMTSLRFNEQVLEVSFLRNAFDVTSAFDTRRAPSSSPASSKHWSTWSLNESPWSLASKPATDPSDPPLLGERPKSALPTTKLRESSPHKILLDTSQRAYSTVNFAHASMSG